MIINPLWIVLLFFGFCCGQVDYARRLTDNHVVRFGLSFSFSSAPSASTTDASHRGI